MSSIPLPTTEKGQRTRRRLLEVARKLALQTGGHIELAGVAETAGVVPSLVHRYFGSKSGLVSALVDDFFDRFHREVLDAPLDEGDWAQHERVRLERGVRFHFAEPFAALVYGAMRLVMVEALGRTPRPAPERVIEVLWRQVSAAVGLDAGTAKKRRPR